MWILLPFGYSTLVWFTFLQRRNLFCWILLNFTQISLLYQILLSIVLVSFVEFTINHCIYWEKFQSLFHFWFGSPTINMLQQLEIRKRIVQRNCLVITSNTQIIPAMIYRKLSGLSRYIQSYYLESSFQMYLDIETNFNHQLTQCLEFQVFSEQLDWLFCMKLFILIEYHFIWISYFQSLYLFAG